MIGLQERLSFQATTKSLVDIATLGDGEDQYHEPVIFDRVADAPVSDPDAPDVTDATQFSGSGRMRFVRQRLDGRGQSLQDRPIANAPKIFLRRPGEDDPVRQSPRSALRSSNGTPACAR